MKNKEASTVATHLLKDVFKVLEPPMIIQSDNGKEFVVKIITEICKALNITIKHDFSRTIAASETSISETITTTFKTTVFKTTTSETITNEVTMEQHISHMLKIHQSINASLEKYREKLGHNNVHKKKTTNNTIEIETEVAIAPDHDMNQQTRKRKLQLTFSERGVFKSLKSNNYTAIVEVNGKDVQIPVKR
ncbi:5679_t:CDS:2, partial [Acaulospora morrowiae]